MSVLGLSIVAVGLAASALVNSAFAQGASVRAMAGEWNTVTVDGTSVVTHDGKKWKAAEGFPLALFERPQPFANGAIRIQFRLIDGEGR